MRALRLTKTKDISISQWPTGGVGIFVNGRKVDERDSLGILNLSLVLLAEIWRRRFPQHETVQAGQTNMLLEPTSLCCAVL
jgi:hypothetical protein